MNTFEYTNHPKTETLPKHIKNKNNLCISYHERISTPAST